MRRLVTKQDYVTALGAIETLMTAKRNTPEGTRLDVLVALVQAYEAKHLAAIDRPGRVQ